MKFFFLILISLSMLISGCTGSLETMVRSNISEFREFVVYGKNEEMSVSLMCGYRETDYKINGYSTELIEFGVLTITLNSDTFEKDNSRYVLFVGTKKYEGDLEINPIDGTLVADIKKIVDKYSNISVVLTIDNNDYSLKLKNVDEKWVISSDDCIKLLINKYKSDLKRFVSDSAFEGEVYIKIMNDEKNLVEDFYYLISVYGRSGKSINVILSPLTGEILASNTNV